MTQKHQLGATGLLLASHRMGRNYLKGRDGERISAVLAAAGYTSASSCAGWRGFCAPSSVPSSPRRPAGYP